jgi:hypothetical protein
MQIDQSRFDLCACSTAAAVLGAIAIPGGAPLIALSGVSAD